MVRKPEVRLSTSLLYHAFSIRAINLSASADAWDGAVNRS